MRSTESPTPVVAPDGRFVLAWPASVGALLACATAAVLATGLVPSPLAFHALLLAAIAWIYVGFALQDGRGSAMVVESLVAFAFFVTALFGLVHAPYVIAAGFVAHALWDVLHHDSVAGIGTSLPAWYPRFCAVYDVVHAALFLALGTFNAAG